MRLYHFTSEHHIQQILADQKLRLAGANITAPWQGNLDESCVWFLDTPTLEFDHGLSAASKLGWGANLKPAVRDKYDKTRIRLTVDLDRSDPLRGLRPVGWIGWAHEQGINDTWFNAIVKAGGGIEAAKHWWITTGEVPAERWVEIENVATGQVLWPWREV
jgi:hypothetical protein